jgi:hypothetical protein
MNTKSILFEKKDSKFILVDQNKLKNALQSCEDLESCLIKIDEVLKEASSVNSGLMSIQDKEKLDNIPESGSAIYTQISNDPISKEQTHTIKFDTNSGLDFDHDGVGIANIKLQNFFKFIEDQYGNRIEADLYKHLKFYNSDTVNVELDSINQTIKFHIKRNIDSYTYESNSPTVSHIINHNLNTFKLRHNIMVRNPLTGDWNGDIVGYKLIDQNTAEINLTVASDIIAIFDKF